ncbi:MAG TPA: MBL fold metallo-hydrolase [bacterium]|nr:MBL fold metallo-hydrolase [bacterium]HOL95613.1 MBL fold metallo-hydrolase [bacterium]HPP01277.1 MBL fold metallo-hydrolase [bacterium]HXK94492.1 MBL fold metallo-hydrolase [bacterium]
MKSIVLIRLIRCAGRLFLGLSLLGVSTGWGRPLEIYFIDVLGGAAVLIVTPQGESVLIDSGWPGEEDRDLNRIHDTLVTKAGCSKLDYLITTHWHRDHYGNVLPLSRRVPIGVFYDRGIPDSFEEDATFFRRMIEEYQQATGGQSKVLRPGDFVDLKQDPDGPPLSLVCVAANRQVIHLQGAEENPDCERAEPQAEDFSDNARSIALLLSYGDFQFFSGGDITWNIETRLVCPVNTVGPVDLYMVNHHGADSSNNPVFLRSLDPIAAVMCNGPAKGGSPATIQRLKDLPGLQALYQLHWNIQIPKEQNTAAGFIANPDPQTSGQYIMASVAPDTKSFVVTFGKDTNPRTFLCR